LSDGERLRDPIKVAAAMIVNALVYGEYGSVARMTGGRFLSGPELERIVVESGESLIPPPNSAYENLPVVQESGNVPTFRVLVPLWSQQYVLSSLVLELRMIETYAGVVDVEVVGLGPLPEDTGLTGEELAAIESVVRALVGKDDEYLREIGAYEHRDPYRWTRRYGPWDHVDLVMPPGEPETWIGYATRGLGGVGVSVGVVMWTVQEGRSDLTLGLEIDPSPDGGLQVRFVHLHVM
jgi:hypothetical protein